MKKQILSIGKVLSRVEQKQVFGGRMEEDPCSGNHNMDKGCLCDTKKPENCSSGVCNKGQHLGFCG